MYLHGLCIRVLNPAYLQAFFAPNAFTPSPVMDTDIFRVGFCFSDQFYLHVIAVGEKSFPLPINIGWDGTFKGETGA
jgi:hypothetical protein